MCLAQCYPPDDERSTFYAQEGLALSKEIGDIDGEASFLSFIGWIEFCRGNIALAVKLKKEAIACFELIGNREWAVRNRGELVYFLIASGDDRKALEQLEKMGKMARESKSQTPSIVCLTYQAYAAWTQREDALALRYCEEAQQRSKDFPESMKFMWHYVLGRVALSQGDLAQAATYLKKFFNLGINYYNWYARAFLALGALAAKEGQMQRAVLLLSAQRILNPWCLKSVSPLELNENEQALAAARAALGEEAFTAAWEAGRMMTTEQVTQYAMEGFTDAPNHDGEVNQT